MRKIGNRHKPKPRPYPYPAPPSGGILSPSNFTLLGGYRVPVVSQGTSDTSEALGGLYFRDSEYIACGPPGNLGYPMRFSLPVGGYGTGAISTWPLLTHTGTVTGVGTPNVLGSPNANWHMGVMKLSNGDYLTSSRSDYAGQAEDWNAPYIHRSTGTTYTPIAGARQIYSTYPGDVPSNFTGTVGSKTCYLAGGGYRSGQGSSAGPALLIFDPSNPASATRVLQFGDFQSTDRASNQTRPATYSNAIFNGLTPDKWQADRVRATAWTPYGLAVIAAMGEGALTYTDQSETFSQNPKLYFGCFSNTDLATALATPGGLASGAIQISTWNPWLDTYCFASNSSSLGAGVYGMWYDATNDRLHVFSRYAWQSGINYYPAIKIYQITPP